MSTGSPSDAPAWATVTTWVVPKRGHTIAECEDAIASRSRGDQLHVAVADGATESAYAQAWAQHLTQALVSNATGERKAEGEASEFERRVRAARARFRQELDARASEAPWYVAQKTEQGAHAAMLVLQVARGGTYSADAVGDVVLFHLRDDRLLASWPLTEADAFTTRPDLVSSLEGVPVPMRTHEGTWEPGDVFLIATDALAAWLLAHPDAQARAAREHDAGAALIDEAHASGMTNDDAALVRVVLGGDVLAEGSG
ncbi:MAG: protein phosphatase 2C domain-containing protein [Bacteroidota bacterium]